MDKEQFSNLLLEQQEKGRALLSLISTMHESRNDFGDGMAILGEVELYYVPEDELDGFRNKFEGWRSYMSDLLKTQFGVDDQFVYDWDSNVGTYISKREPILPQLKKKVNKGLALIESFLQRLDFRFHDELTEMPPIQDNIVRCPMVFISHSSKDKDIISSFVEQILRLGLGLTPDDIAYTSEESFGVEPGENIAKYIHENISGATVVLLMISPSYRQSEVCLNEMGAAWALGKKCVSVVLPGADFSYLGWLSSLEKAVQMCEKDNLVSLSGKLAELMQIDISKRFKSLSSGIDKFLAMEKTVILPKSIPSKNAKIFKTTESIQLLKAFDVSFNSICLEEGEYVIQINLRLRSDESCVSLRRVFLRNKAPFTGSSYKGSDELEFKSYLDHETVDLSNLKKQDIEFWRKEYPKRCHQLLDLTIEKGHNLSISFWEYFFTIRESDGYEELQLKGWNLVIQYNIDAELTIPLELIPVDKNAAGKYLHN